ncbi:uncharacterized protein LOC119976559 [Scyliorhinus canicula]|uniref:uncharacterized protein LOC119976559 n=1 Tax=Scyliorhinus canicula TaxID=7830 RepID=UPI0018F5828A|nr:uncharacterized protein LOC119976559 [Scyliorhinus canicula]
MHFLTRVPREEPQIDWEGGYFCPHVAVFVLFYFSCMLIVLTTYSSFLQIFNGVRTILKSSRRTQSVECDSGAPQGSLLLRPLAALKRRVGSMLGAVFRRWGDGKGHRRVHYPLERTVPPSNTQLRHLKAGRHHRRQRSQYPHSSSGEILCYMPHKTLSYPYANQTAIEIFKFRGFNRVDVWKTRYSRSGYRFVRSGGEAGLKTAVSIAAIENRLEVEHRLSSPFRSYGRSRFKQPQ